MGKTSKSKADRVRELSAAGFTVKQIAAKIGCNPSYVHQIRWLDKKSASKAVGTGVTGIKRKPGRPRKVIVPPTTPQEAEMLRNETWTITAKYDEPRLTWRQRLRALFTGRV